MPREVILYTRRLCGLCDEAAAELRRLRDELRFTLVELDVDDDANLRARYDEAVPVVAVADRVIAQSPIDPAGLRRVLTAALNGSARRTRPTMRRERTASGFLISILRRHPSVRAAYAPTFLPARSGRRRAKRQH